MTAAELIEHLRQYPAETPVLVQGYETGWDSIHSMRLANVVPYCKANAWDGEYQEAREFKRPETSFPAILIEGRRGHLRAEQRIGVAKGVFELPED